MPWAGSKPKIYTGSKDKYEELVRDYKEYFPTYSVLFQIAAAVGIVLDQKKELTKREELVNTYSIDKDGTLELLMRIKYPDLSPEERLEELEKYAEAGIEVIYEETVSSGHFDFRKYAEL